MDKHEIAAQLNAGIDAADIAGYDAAASAEWSAKEGQNVHIIDGLLFAYNPGGSGFGPNRDQVIEPHWRSAGRIAPAPRLSPAAEAYRIGAGYGIDGQIWDNA